MGIALIINFSDQAVKFLKKIDEKSSERIRIKIKDLYIYLNEFEVIPFMNMNIKKLEGEWKGCYRLRIGKVRVIFEIDKNSDTLIIHTIDFRGNVYK